MSRRQAGFTLLEVLVALMVLGLLVVGLTQGVRAGLALWQAQTRRVGEVAELDAAARVLRTLLSGVAPPVSGAAANSAMTITGTADRLEFVGNLPTGLGTTQRADIVLEPKDGRLMLIWTPHRHETSTAPPPKPVETELIGRIARLDLSYWGSPGADQPAGWQEKWDGAQFPVLIRLRLAFAKGDPRHWPDLIVAPQL